MKKSCIIFLLLFLVATASSRAQGDRKFGSFMLSNVSYNYAYYLPSEYDPVKTYPAVVGPGEGIPGSDKCFFWNVSNPGKLGWILIEFPFWKQNSNIVEALLRHLNEKFNIEGDKFHIVGYGTNAASSFNHVISNPQYFHSVTGVPGHPSSKNTDQLKSLKNIKIQNIIGEKDQKELKSGREFEAFYKELGLSSRLEIVPGGENELRQLTGEGFFTKMELMRK